MLAKRIEWRGVLQERGGLLCKVGEATEDERVIRCQKLSGNRSQAEVVSIGGNARTDASLERTTGMEQAIAEGSGTTVGIRLRRIGER